MNNIFSESIFVDLNYANGTYNSLNIRSDLDFSASFIRTDSQPINVVNNIITFDGTYALETNSINIIDFAKERVYIEFDLKITDKSNSYNNDGGQYIFTLTDKVSNKRVATFTVSVTHKYANLCFYNTNDQRYTTHHVYYDFNENISYNFKIIKYNNYILIYVDNILKYKTNYWNNSNSTTGGTRIDYFSNYILRLGQAYNIGNGSNLKGTIANFKSLSYNILPDNLIKQNTEKNSEYLLYHIPFDYIEILPLYYVSYYPIINIGNDQSISLSSPNYNSSKHFYNLNQTYWWYKPIGHRVYFNKNIFKENKVFSLYFKLYTSSTMGAGFIVDTRSSGSEYNNMQLTMSSADPTTFTLRYTNAATKTSWLFEHTFPTGILAPDTEYSIGFILNNNTFTLLINNDEIETINVNFDIINWTSNVTDFFNNLSGTSPIMHYVRDLRFYNAVVRDFSIDNNRIINVLKDYSYSFNEDHTINYYLHNVPSRPLLKNYKDVVIYKNGEKNNKIYIFNDIQIASFDYFLFAEGDPNKMLYVYLNNILLYTAKGEITLNITNNFNRYTYQLEGDSKFRPLPQHLIKGHIEVTINSASCVGSDLFIRLHNTKTGEHIGDYNLINNYCIINNLNYLSEYDAILIDRNKVLENKVRSKLKPVLTKSIEPRESSMIVREITYYEACLKYTKEFIDNKLVATPNISLISIDAKNTDTDINSAIIMNYNKKYEEVATININPIIKVNSLLNELDHQLYIYGSDLSRIKIGSIIAINNELLYVESINYGAGIVNVLRGIIDTMPARHVTDTAINILNDNLYMDNFINNNTTLNFKVLSVKSYISDINKVQSYTKIVTGRLNAPLPPANIKINGVYNLTETDTTNKLILTWDHRNHTVLKDYYDTTTVTNLDDNIVYRLTVYKIDKNNKETLFLKENIGTVTTYTINLSTDLTIFKYRVILSSIKNGTIESYYNYDHIINTYFTPPFNITVTTI